MITPNVSTKLPGSALSYKLTGSLILTIIFIIIAFFLMSLGSVQGTSTVGGATSATTFSTIVPAIILIVIGLLFPIYSFLWYTTFSYIVADQLITLNSGVIFKQSKTIAFNKIQNVNNVRGPMQMMFGLTEVDIWTASPDQMTITTVNYGNNQQGVKMQPKPEGKLYLLKQDADDLNTYISQKSTVQNVKIV
jgi:uncharacterized membrane protein YdbT with pleckstrin-like domain